MLANSKSWQTRFFTRHGTHTVVCSKTGLVQRRSRRTVEKKRRDIKRWRNRKVWTKPTLFTSSFIFFCLFLEAGGETFHTTRQLWSYTIKLEVASHSSWLASTVLRTVTQINHVNGALALVQSTVTNTFANRSHVRYGLTNAKMLVKNIGKNGDNFFSSPAVCQHFCRLIFLCRSHTHTHTHQFEFANTRFPTLVCHVEAT